MKLCRKCNTPKHSREFYSNPKYPSGLSCWCRECIKSQAHDRYDPVRQKAYSLSVRERDRSKRNRRKVGYRKNMSSSKKLLRRMSNGILRSLRCKKSKRRWQTLVGYTVGDLKKHLESLFQPGMTWDNYGINGWHIDHVFPQSRLVMDGPDDPTFKFCWSLLNLQPLWSDDNIDKADLVV